MRAEPDPDATRLLALFDALLDLPSHQQQARLQTLAQSEPRLAAALRGMLAADAEDGMLDEDLQSAAPTVLGQLGPGVESPPEFVDRSGQAFGPYVLERPLGRGGMGEVWCAVRSEGDFRMEVAIKLLDSPLNAPDRHRRFAREQRILATLAHPGIARFVDAGVQDGLPWFAMERVDGEPITAYADRARLDLRARVALLVEVAEAVAYAHARLVVHRDLKPANVLVDRGGRVRLLDFGIAKVLEDDAGEATRTGLRALSPAYAAPEQVLGGEITVATDVYALGMLLYELLTGSLPHQRQRLRLEQLADALRTESVERPSERLRTKQAPPGLSARAARELAGDLDTIVLVALRSEPERRYASATALLEDLQCWAEGRPVRARADSARYRSLRFIGRHRLAVGSAAAFVLALVLGLGLALWQAGVARDQAIRADVEARRAAAQAQRATAVKRFFVGMFQQGGPTQQRRGAETTAREWVEDALASIESELATAPEAQADVRTALAASLLAFGENAQARSLLEAALPQLRAKADQEPAELVSALHYLARIQRDSDELADASRSLQEALVLNERVQDREARLDTALQLRTQLLTQANAEGRFEEALELGRALLRDRALRHGEDSAKLAVDWNNLGQTFNVLDRATEAAQALGRALVLLQADPESPLSRQAYVHAGLCLAALGEGRLQAALEHAAQANALGARTLDPAHLIVQLSEACRINALRYLGRYAEARALRPLAVSEEGSRANAAQGATELALGLSELASGEWGEATRLLAAAQVNFERWPPRNPATALAARLGWHAAQGGLGQCKGAVEAVDQVLSALQALSLPDGWRRAELEALGGRVLEACGDRAQGAALWSVGHARWQRAWSASGTEPPDMPALASPAPD